MVWVKSRLYACAQSVIYKQLNDETLGGKLANQHRCLSVIIVSSCIEVIVINFQPF